MESVKTPNTKPSQFEALVQYMSNHPDLSKGYLKTPDARKKANELWEKLANELNAEGPPVRNAVGWKKVWADFKVHTKAKLRKNKVNLMGTGGGPAKYFALTPLEEKASELLQLNDAISGMRGSMSFGLKNINKMHVANGDLNNIGDFEIESTSLLEPDEVMICHEENLSFGKENIPQERNTPKKKQFSLLETQVGNQIDFHNKMCNTLNDVNLNLERIARYLKRDVEFKEKNYKLKKESLELKKEKFKFKKQSEIERNKNKLAKLELKKEILRLRHEMNPSYL